MSRKRTQRRRGSFNGYTTVCEKFEDRALLTQLVPIADLAGRFPSIVNETPDAAILSVPTGQANEIAVAVLNKQSGVLGTWQPLEGGPDILASPDGNTLLTSSTLFDPVSGVFTGRKYVFYRQSASTGLFETTARYDLSSSEFGYSLPAEAMTAEGAYVNTYASSSPANLFFLRANAAPEPHLVFGNVSGAANLAVGGSHVFAFGEIIGLQLLQPDGINPTRLGAPGDVPLGLAGRKLFVSRNAGSLSSLVSIDLDTRIEQNLLDRPGDGFYQLYSEGGGPGGKTILGHSGPGEFDIIATDGTLAGTDVFPASSHVAGEFYLTSAILVAGTTRVLVSRSGRELWVWDLSDGSNHRLVDTNPFGSDRISGISGSGPGTWFVAQMADSRFGVYRTDGLQATLEVQLPGDSAAQVIAGMDQAYLLDRNPSTRAVPRYRPALYKIDQQAPDLSPGPMNLKTKIVVGGNSQRLHIHWDAIGGVDSYEILVRPWEETGQPAVGMRFMDASAVAGGTEYSFNIMGLGYYGWQTVLVRGITNTGAVTQWSTSTFSFTHPPTIDPSVRFFFDHNTWRLGLPGVWGQNNRVQIRRSDDPTSGFIFDSPVTLHREERTANSPFPDANSYYYLALPNLPDGDYTVEFVNLYVDPIPDTRSLSLPRVSKALPISIRNQTIIRNPEALNVAIQPNGVQFSWTGSLELTDEGFEVWVSDIGRDIPRVIHQNVVGHSLLYDLPNGRYRGWVGLKDRATALTYWTPAKEFDVANKAPQVLSPGPVNAVERPLFRWTGSKSSNYEVWLTDLGSGQRIFLATVNGAIQWTPQSKLPAGKYAFFVRELVSSTAASPWSTRLVFTQQEPAIKVTSGLNPGVDQTPIIGWQANERAVSYELWIGRVGIPGSAYRQTGIKRTSHRVETPLGNGHFTVWVRADLGGGKTTAWGAGDRMVIGAPVVLRVSGTTVSWSAVPSATHYELWINYDDGERTKQARIVYQAVYIQTSYTLLPPLPKGHYTAWIRAVRAEAGSLYLSAWSQPVKIQLSQAMKPEVSDALVLTELFAVIARHGLADNLENSQAVAGQPASDTDDSTQSVRVPTEPANAGRNPVRAERKTRNVEGENKWVGLADPVVLKTNSGQEDGQE